tara:strand:- start:27 stop:293 length:267 start_codon:yes stop_codon:yes gene_type:complete
MLALTRFLFINHRPVWAAQHLLRDFLVAFAAFVLHVCTSEGGPSMAGHTICHHQFAQRSCGLLSILSIQKAYTLFRKDGSLGMLLCLH